MRVALYLRVSTENKGQNPENQLRQLREYYQAQKWDLVKEYVDYDSASKKRDGQQFQGMFEDARQRKFDLLLFWSLDRFSREGVLKTLTYLNQLSQYGVEYFSFTEQYLNTIGIFKEAIIGILATIAKQESIRISERTKAGMARAKAEGKSMGRPKTLITGEQVTALRKQGLSWPEISRRLRCGQATAIRVYQQVNPDWKPLQKAHFKVASGLLQTKDLEKPAGLAEAY